MTITLEHQPGNVAVLRGVSSKSALAHLGRCLAHGAPFDGYRGLVVDLGGVTTADPALAAVLDAASSACLRRRQVVAFAADGGDIANRLRAVRAILQLLEREGGLTRASRLAQVQASVLAGVATAAFEFVVVPLRHLGARPHHDPRLSPDWRARV